MDIHKPKPWHRLREFLKEYAIIVVGVLTALGAEQTVTWLHESRELRETREAIRLEMADDAARAETAAREDRCVFGVLSHFDQWAKGGPSPTHAAGSRPYLSPMFTTTVWDASQTGAVSRMPLKEKFEDAHYYEGIRDLQGFAVISRAQGTRLSRFFSLAVLTPADAKELGETVSEAQTTLYFKLMNERAVVQRATSMGVTPLPISAQIRRALESECSGAGMSSPDFSKPLSPPGFSVLRNDLLTHD